jgi:hypothetical protein
VKRTLKAALAVLGLVAVLSACSPQQMMQWRIEHGRAFPGSSPHEQVRNFQPRSQGGLAPIDSVTHPICHRRGGGVSANPCPVGSTGPLTLAQVQQVQREAQVATAVWGAIIQQQQQRSDLVWRWSGVAQCESGGNWSTNTGNGYYGGLQFLPSTWRSVGGTGLPHQHSAAEQAYRAEILKDRAGLGQWPHCGRHYRH